MPLITREVHEYHAAFREESDRGCALIAASYLDVSLERALRNRLVDLHSVQEELFGRARPLASFSAKIDLAALVGVIDLVAHRELHLIRRIRNDFGHLPVRTTFATLAIRSRCNELQYRLVNKLPPRRAFEYSSMMLLGQIHGRSGKPRKLRSPAGLDLKAFERVGKLLAGEGTK
jgi:hypothetical protein